jgi:hypothetical protein
MAALLKRDGPMRHTTKNLKNRRRLQKIAKKLHREAKQARRTQRRAKPA